MNLSLYLPFCVSFAIGLIFSQLLFFKKNESLLLKIFLAWPLGAGLSAQITFLSFLFYNQLNTAFVFFIHIGILLVLSFLLFKRYRRENVKFTLFRSLTREEVIAVLIILIFSYPTILQALMYPLGGWDAWSAWNLKAKILFLGGDNWKNIFDSALWRSSPHYPLLLPLINVWGWSLGQTAIYDIPLTTSVLFTLSTAGLLFSFLQKLKAPKLGLLASACLLSLPTFIKFATSQYADIVVGCYLLGALAGLVIAEKDNNIGLVIVSGLFLGFLSFTKNEGMMAAVIIAFFSLFHFLRSKTIVLPKKFLSLFMAATFLSCLIPLIFAFFYAPKNLTQINGLSSTEAPSTLKRLLFIFSYYGVELISPKWNGIFVIALGGVLLNFKNAFSRALAIVPLTLASYMGVITAFYFINTKWEIAWWLEVSLTRILVSLLPTIVFWAIGSFCFQKSSAKI